MTIAQALAQAAALGIERLDAQLLLLHALGRAQSDRAWLLAHDGDKISDTQEVEFRELCGRRQHGEPLAYIVGRKEFFGLELMVDRRVLVPRPDTETLVEWALEVIPRGPSTLRQAQDGTSSGRTEISVVDLGTGSGAIALAIKKMRPDVRLDAVDVSQDAVCVATENAKALGLEVRFRLGSWLAGTSERYDVIVSNPPYVAQADPHLPSLTHEPRNALSAGVDGLDAIRTIVSQAPAHLKRGGWLLLEHGWDQAAGVRSLLHSAGFAGVASRRDLAGIERCSGGQWLELG